MTRSPRLSRPPSSRSRVFTLRLPEALVKRLDKHLDRRFEEYPLRITRAQFIRYVLEKALEVEEKELAKA